MPPTSILVAQTTRDILAEAIADGIRGRSDAALSFDRVVPVTELFALLDRGELRPDVVILVGLDAELNRLANDLLAAHPSIVAVRIIIGDEVVHVDLRQIDLDELILSACGLFRQHAASQEQRLTAYKVESSQSNSEAGGIRLGLVELQHRRTLLDEALAWLDAVLRLHLERSAGEGSDLPGLSVSRSTIERLLSDTSSKRDRHLQDARLAVESASTRLMCALEQGEPLLDPLAGLCNGLGFSTLEIQAFLLCLAPELDPKYSRIFGFINDDLGQRSASLGLISQVLGDSVASRIALANSAALLRSRVVGAHGHALPYADDPLRVDPTLVAWILGNRGALQRDPHLMGVVDPEPWIGGNWLGDPADLTLLETLEEILASGPRRSHWLVLTGNDGSVWRALVERVTDRLAAPILRISSAGLDGLDGDSLDARLVRLGWAARLTRSIPVIDASDAVGVDRSDNALRRIIQSFNDVRQTCVLIVPDANHAIQHLPRDDYQLLRRNTSETAPPIAALTAATREAGLTLSDSDNARLASAYPLPLDRLGRAVRLAGALGASPRQPAEEQAMRLAEACRIVACPELPRYATMLEPSFRLDQVVLPPDRRQQIEDIVSHVLYAKTVLDTWGFNAQLPYGKGVAALFSGPSGTGKTMAARAIGHALQRGVFSVDLSRVVSKYIGETEKNLDAVFAEAERASAILLFNEADALFGKRSEVKDAHDRYANIETAYLLQRMESFGGLAILTSNLGQNLDRAFLRRLRFVVEFPMPDAIARERIWRQCLPPEAPLAADIDFHFLSKRVEITGGNIRQATLRAAFAAAAEGPDGTPIAMRHILQATRAEVLKLGMPGLERELAELAA